MFVIVIFWPCRLEFIPYRHGEIPLGHTQSFLVLLALFRMMLALLFSCLRALEIVFLSTTFHCISEHLMTLLDLQ